MFLLPINIDQYNDNNGNPYSDAFWLAALIQSVGELEFGQQVSVMSYLMFSMHALYCDKLVLHDSNHNIFFIRHLNSWFCQILPIAVPSYLPLLLCLLDATGIPDPKTKLLTKDFYLLSTITLSSLSAPLVFALCVMCMS